MFLGLCKSKGKLFYKTYALCPRPYHLLKVLPQFQAIFLFSHSLFYSFRNDDEGVSLILLNKTFPFTREVISVFFSFVSLNTD